MLITYLEQMELAAMRAGLDLRAVCRLEGVALTTLNRWRSGSNWPRQQTTEAILARIARMAAEAKANE